MSVILGLNAFHAGSSAAIVIDGQPVAAIAEERLNRRKYYAGFPKLAIARCLQMAGLRLSDIDVVAVGRDSSKNLGKKIEYTLRNPSKLLNLIKVKAARSTLDDLKSLIIKEFDADPATLRFEQINVEHHLAHIASAYFISDWDQATGISIDGSGDFVTCMMAQCEGEKIEIKNRVYVPHSLGSLYTMICEFIGYQSYGDEGKVMGLSALGKDRYVDRVSEMVQLDGSGIRLVNEYFQPFGSGQGLKIDEEGKMVIARHYSDRIVELFGQPRDPGEELTQRDMDLAFAVQHTFEKAYFHLLNTAHKLAPSERLAMAGGCALNSVANGKLFDHTPFGQTCIQPAAGDEGLALGAALYVSNTIRKEGHRFVMKDSYLGPEFSAAEIKAALDQHGVKYAQLERETLLEETATDIAKGKVVGWFQGRMEWGPRALGNRSILAHPGLPNMKDVLNARIKRREWFRPFAPAVLAEQQSKIFEKSHPSPFMLHVYDIKPEWRERLPAVNHVDNTGRLQSVARDENPLYYDLIRKFSEKTGIPILLNTSFNENEPVVCNPGEAIGCFQRTKMDTLVIGPFVCRKPEIVRPMHDTGRTWLGTAATA